MECNLRRLRLDASIVHDHATQLRRRSRPWLARRHGGPHEVERDAFQALRERFTPDDERPDLEAEVRRRGCLPDAHAVRVLTSVADAIEALAHARLLVIDACRIDDRGRVFVATSLPGTTNLVRAGDELLSGAYLFAVLERDEVTVGARFVRAACWTGIALPGRSVTPREDVARILRQSAARRVGQVVRTLESTTWIAADDPVAALATLAVHVPAGDRDALRHQFEGARERTLYGTICALTALASATTEPHRQMRLEALAGAAVLACVPLADPMADPRRSLRFVHRGTHRVRERA